MEQLILDIERHCTERQITPQAFLREVINASWRQWQDWKDGKASPRLETADRIRAYMRANPPPAPDAGAPAVAPPETDAA